MKILFFCMPTAELKIHIVFFVPGCDINCIRLPFSGSVKTDVPQSAQWFSRLLLKRLQSCLWLSTT